MADRLGRPAPGDGPSAALDASILAAARAATAAAATPRQSPRWPAMLGIAATLVMASGLVWQLRPGPGAVDVQGEVPATAAPSTRAESTLSPEPVIPDQPEAAEQAPVAATAASKPSTDVAPSTDERTSIPARKSAATPDDAPAPALRGMLPAGSGSAATAAPAARDLQAPPTRPVSDNDPRAFPAAAPTPPPAAVMRKGQPASQSSRDSMAAQESITPSAAIGSDEAADDQQLQPDAWLERIRQRRDDGDMEGARDSLERFLQAHPDRRLPGDLRSLLDTPAP